MPSLDEFLQRADLLLQRLEPLLPSLPETPDWQRVLAARWQVGPGGGALQALDVRLDLTLADLVGIDNQRDLLVRNRGG